MELTVGILKQIIKDLPDDVILADLGIGNDRFHPFMGVKRLMLLQGDGSWNDQQFLTINSMGSHYTKQGEQSSLFYLDKNWDSETLNSES